MPDPQPILMMVRELNLGGCERDLTKIACRLDRSRFQPHVGCFHPVGLRAQELQAAGIPIVRFPVRSFKSFSAVEGAWQMGRYIEQHRIRLVHAFDVPTDVFGIAVARLYRVPVAISSQLSYRDLAPVFSRYMLRVIDGLIDRVVVNCKAMEKHLVEDERVPPDRIYLCYNGVDTEVFRPAALPRPAPLADASLVIGTVCALRPEKDLLTLVEGFARVRGLRPGIKLAIIGDGPVRKELEARCRRMSLDRDVHFEPATQQVPRWLQSMDIFVLPSRSEAFSNALLEAMACGCAAVGSRVGGTPELISHGVTGLLFESGDVDGLATQLSLLIQDESLRRGLGVEAARFSHENLSIDRAVRRTEELYSMLLER
jgi:glycosyltransferase involved in cell wall biosynthesis